ncbi:MAG: M24 family metallopeptidase [Ignavibacteriales bacterium]|nr:M24 family metallopeptidase [Ignavibacteriales bacterium]
MKPIYRKVQAVSRLGIMRLMVVFCLALVASVQSRAQTVKSPLPSLREQDAVQQEWLKLRLERVLPSLMRAHKVQMWIVPMREYNEDPVFSSLVSATTFSARRRTIYVFSDRGPEKGLERLALGGSSQGGLYSAYRDTTLKNAELIGDVQWKLLSKLVAERDPGTISVNISSVHAFSDGLSAGEWEQLQKALGPKYLPRVIRADRLPLDYIATRLPEMLQVYEEMMRTVHAIIGEAFSSSVITPGKTTTQDVVWWMRQKIQQLGMTTWFQPSVDIQRFGADLSGTPNPVIERGDVLHCDFGITGMRLNTDTQHMAYVLNQGEADVPSGIQHTLSVSNRLQDIVVSSMKVGLTGNQILAQSLAEMRKAGIDGSVYSHPIGEHGHGAGTLIGLWDRQNGVPDRGDVPVIPNTWYSIELQAGTKVPEWNNQVVRSAQEEDVIVDGDGTVRWVIGRQTQFHLIR